MNHIDAVYQDLEATRADLQRLREENARLTANNNGATRKVNELVAEVARLTKCEEPRIIGWAWLRPDGTTRGLTFDRPNDEIPDCAVAALYAAPPGRDLQAEIARLKTEVDLRKREEARMREALERRAESAEAEIASLRAQHDGTRRELVSEWWEAHGKRYPTKDAVRDVCVAHYLRVRRYRVKP